MVFFIQNLLKYPIITKNPHLKDEDFLTLQKKISALLEYLIKFYLLNSNLKTLPLI